MLIISPTRYFQLTYQELPADNAPKLNVVGVPGTLTTRLGLPHCQERDQGQPDRYVLQSEAGGPFARMSVWIVC